MTRRPGGPAAPVRPCAGGATAHPVRPACGKERPRGGGGRHARRPPVRRAGARAVRC